MPTYQRLPRVDQDWRLLSSTDQQRFRTAVRRFVEDLEAGRPFRLGLRVKAVQGTGDIMEMMFPCLSALRETSAAVTVIE